MILEIAEILVRPGTESGFEAAVKEAAPLFKRAKGCVSMRLERGIEQQNSYLLVVGWECLEDHTVCFRGSADFQEWRKLAGPYFLEPPVVKHVAEAVHGF